MRAAARTSALLAAILAFVWLSAAAIVAIVLHSHRAERGANYVDVDPARSFAAQGSPAFVALRGRVADPGPLELRRGNQSERTWYVPLLAVGTSATQEVRWIVRHEGASLPILDGPLLAHHASNALPQVVRDEFERANLHLADNAVVVDWVPSRQGFVLDRDADSVTFAAGVAGLVSMIVGVLFGMLSMLNARHARRVSGNLPLARSSRR